MRKYNHQSESVNHPPMKTTTPITTTWAMKPTRKMTSIAPLITSPSHDIRRVDRRAHAFKRKMPTPVIRARIPNEINATLEANKTILYCASVAGRIAIMMSNAMSKNEQTPCKLRMTPPVVRPMDRLVIKCPLRNLFD